MTGPLRWLSCVTLGLLAAASSEEPVWQRISAVSFATPDLVASVQFYEDLGLVRRAGSSREWLAPGFLQDKFRIELYADDSRPLQPGLQDWGRAIMYPSDVDKMYQRARAANYTPEFAPKNASFGERYFQIRDPAGHEIAFNRPLNEAPVDPLVWETINAITLATVDMNASVFFYQQLGLVLTYHSPQFSTLGLGGDDNTFHVNLQANTSAQEMPQRWGKVAFLVSSVDGLYSRVKAAGLHTESAPHDAAWGERYFSMRDPSGHHIAFARPLDSPATNPGHGGALAPTILITVLVLLTAAVAIVGIRMVHLASVRLDASMQVSLQPAEEAERDAAAAAA